MCAYIRKHLEELHVLVFRPVRCSEDLSKCFRSIETWVLFMLPVLKRPMCRSCIFYGLSWICFSSSAAMQMHSKPFSLIVLWVPPSFFFDTPFSFLCAHKNCCTHATSFTQRLVIQLARSFLPSYFLMHLSSMCLFRARLHCWDISESLLPIPFSRCTMPSTRTPRRPISTFPTIRTRWRPSSTSMHVSSGLKCRPNVHVH